MDEVRKPINSVCTWHSPKVLYRLLHRAASAHKQEKLSCLTDYLALTHPDRGTLLLIYEFPHFPVPGFGARERDAAAKRVAPNFLQLLALLKQFLAALVGCPADTHTHTNVISQPAPCTQYSLYFSANKCN
jgi:hypothetical protein